MCWHRRLRWLHPELPLLRDALLTAGKPAPSPLLIGGCTSGGEQHGPEWGTLAASLALSAYSMCCARNMTTWYARCCAPPEDAAALAGTGGMPPLLALRMYNKFFNPVTLSPQRTLYCALPENEPSHTNSVLRRCLCGHAVPPCRPDLNLHAGGPWQLGAACKPPCSPVLLILPACTLRQ